MADDDRKRRSEQGGPGTAVITVIVLTLGIIAFNRAERTVVDSV